MIQIYIDMFHNIIILNNNKYAITTQKFMKEVRLIKTLKGTHHM